MERILISWVGGHDVDGVGRNGKPIPGPILSTLREESFDRVELLYNYSQDEKDVEGYLARLEGRNQCSHKCSKGRSFVPDCLWRDLRGC